VPQYFSDTSAVLKLYFDELGSDWMGSLDLRSLTLSALAIPEGASAIARRRHEGVISDRDARDMWRNLRNDAQGWVLIDLAQPLLVHAGAILIRTVAAAPLRALDAMQLACALEAQREYRRAGIGPLTFLTADTRLELAARRAGLDVDNPERHSF
jgi:predicted nucleic acid-binding protein